MNEITEGMKLGSQKLRQFLSSIVEPHVASLFLFCFVCFACDLRSPVPFSKLAFSAY